MSENKENLEIVDTKNVLTVEELQELKKLVNMSKTAKTVIAIAMGVVMLVGGDKLIELVQAHTQVTH